MIPGSDCGSMGSVLPGYFDGLDGKAGGTRIFILHKRFIGTGADGNCSDEFTRADHPLRWLADQEEFIRTELAAARANGQAPDRIAVVGISEGAEIAPALARQIRDVTHIALLANGGMDPFDAYKLQMQRHGLHHALADIDRLCRAPSDAIVAAERTCRYWKELQEIRHTDNLLALDIPIFMAIGEADAMVPVETAWFIQGKFATQGKKNLHLLTIPGASHDFRRDGESVLPYLWEAFAHWLRQ
jgi:pimeloyl-ACP methyl ester carboxylesterase